MKITNELQAIINEAVEAEKECVRYYVEHHAYVEGDATYAKLVGASDAYRTVILTLDLKDAYLERYGKTDRYGNEKEGK